MRRFILKMVSLATLCAVAVFFIYYIDFGCSVLHEVKNQDIAQSLTVTNAQDDIPESALQMMRLVEKVNEFCREELRYVKFTNFRRYQKEVKIAYALKLAPKDRLYYDYSLSETEGKTFDTLEEAMQMAEKIKDRFDVYVYRSDAFAGGYPITDPFIALSLSRQVFVIIHEDWHDNISFSYSLEEATGNMLGYLGALKYFKKKDKDEKRYKDMEQTLRWTREKARIVVKYYSILENLYESPGLDNSVLANAREEIFSNAKKECKEVEKRTGIHLSGLEFNNATLSNWMTYDRYLDLTWRVYLGMGKDLKKTAAIFRSIKPISEYSWWPSMLMNKEKIKEYEADVVKYLEQFAVPPEKAKSY